MIPTTENNTRSTDTAGQAATRHRSTRKLVNVLLSLLLCGAILYWMYRDFDFNAVTTALASDMNWWWMIASFPFGILAQAFRGWRWRQMLTPLGVQPTQATCVGSVFMAYAISLVIPRTGGFLRSGIMTQHGMSFAKAWGTIFTERAIDTITVIILTTIVAIGQMSVVESFLGKTGTPDASFPTGKVVTILCIVAIIYALYKMRKRIGFYYKIKGAAIDIKDGILSLRKVKNHPLFFFNSLMIWVCYFLHFSLTFQCFEATAGLGMDCAILAFIAGTLSVLVPTPNGAGPWHFAISTMLMLFGVAEAPALVFVLIVHGIQTLLVALLGIIGWAHWVSTKK